MSGHWSDAPPDRVVTMARPPSTNALWVRAPGKPRVRLRLTATGYARRGGTCGARLPGMPPIDCRFNVVIEVPISKRDSGNFEKPTMDLCEHVGLVTNDGNAHEINIRPVPREDVMVAIWCLPEMGEIRKQAKPRGTGQRERTGRTVKRKLPGLTWKPLRVSEPTGIVRGWGRREIPAGKGPAGSQRESSDGRTSQAPASDSRAGRDLSQDRDQHNPSVGQGPVQTTGLALSPSWPHPTTTTSPSATRAASRGRTGRRPSGSGCLALIREHVFHQRRYIGFLLVGVVFVHDSRHQAFDGNRSGWRVRLFRPPFVQHFHVPFRNMETERGSVMTRDDVRDRVWTRPKGAFEPFRCPAGFRVGSYFGSGRVSHEWRVQRTER